MAKAWPPARPDAQMSVGLSALIEYRDPAGPVHATDQRVPSQWSMTVRPPVPPPAAQALVGESTATASNCAPTAGAGTSDHRAKTPLPVAAPAGMDASV